MEGVRNKLEPIGKRTVRLTLNTAHSLYNNAQSILSGLIDNNEFLMSIHEELEDGNIFFTVSAEGSGLLIYKTLPEKNEWLPFIEVLREYSFSKNEASRKWLLAEEATREQMHIIIAISPICPHCAEVVRNFGSFLTQHPHLSVEIIDVMATPRIVEEFNIQSTPTVIVNDELIFIGDVSYEEIVAYLNASDGKNRQKKRIEFFLANNALDDAVSVIQHHPESIGFMVEKLQSPLLSTRVQAMTLLEELIDAERELCRSIVPELIDLLTTEDITILSDIIYALGVIGDKRARTSLQKLTLHDNEDVSEGAQDALEELDVE